MYIPAVLFKYAIVIQWPWNIVVTLTSILMGILGYVGIGFLTSVQHLVNHIMMRLSYFASQGLTLET